MAASAATSGFGVLLKDGGTTIAEVKSISGPNFQVSFAEVTHMESPSAVREYIPTLIEPGDVTFTVNFLPDDTTHDNMRTRLLARTSRTFTLHLTDSPSDTWTFTGYYSQLGLTANIDGPLEANVGIKVTSTVTVS